MSASVPVIRAGTRGSALARIQVEEARAVLGRLLPGLRLDRVILGTPGDRDQQQDLRSSPPDFFTRDLHDAVRDGRIDCAVHSAKDLEDDLPDGIDAFWLPSDMDARDALVTRPCGTLDQLPSDARIGISSDRRADYCRRRFPRARLMSVRGPIDVRLAKLDRGDYDLLIVAAAALQRLGLQSRIAQWIALDELPPPDGQGVLALAYAAGDSRFEQLRSLVVKPVVFAGAGPGDAGLCTEAALGALRRADVCLHDALAPPALLDRLPRHARRIDVGKRAGAHRAEQADIDRLLVMYARRGLRVVRLKGGDPGIFGRLSEEIDALSRWHLPFHIIPGVSSLSAATTGTGLLLTRRGVSRGFVALTPRGEHGDYVPLSQAEPPRIPLACFMAGGLLQDLSRDALARGYSPDVPVAVVVDAGSDLQQVHHATVETMAQVVPRPIGPALVVIGHTAAARYLNGMAGGALRHRRVLLTCSTELQPDMIQAILDRGGRPVSRPLIRIEPNPAAARVLATAGRYTWLVLASPSAVNALAALAAEVRLDWRRLPRILAAGPATARRLEERGFYADLTAPRPYGAEALAAAARQVLTPEARVLRCRSDQSDDRLSDLLRAAGAAVTDCLLYRHRPSDLLPLPSCEAVVFASGSAVRAGVMQWGAAAFANTVCAVMGEPTAKSFQSACGRSPEVVAPAASSEALAQALASWYVARDPTTHVRIPTRAGIG